LLHQSFIFIQGALVHKIGPGSKSYDWHLYFVFSNSIRAFRMRYHLLETLKLFQENSVWWRCNKFYCYPLIIINDFIKVSKALDIWWLTKHTIYYIGHMLSLLSKAKRNIIEGYCFSFRRLLSLGYYGENIRMVGITITFSTKKVTIYLKLKASLVKCGVQFDDKYWENYQYLKYY